MKRIRTILILAALSVLLLFPLSNLGARTVRLVDALTGPASPDSSGIFTNTGQQLSSDANDVALGDIDGDGDLDVFIATNSGYRVWINQGNAQAGTLGVFLNSGQILGSSLSLGIALGDLDGDGDLDAFGIEDDATGNAIWINQGNAQSGTSGVFASNGQSNGNDLSSNVALGDVDGDNDLDAFVARHIGRPDKVWLNNGAGQFSDSGQSLGSGSSIDVALGDLDGDADLDAFIADASINTVWINQGGAQAGSAGTFLDSGQSLSDALSVAVAVGDIDRDGDLDAVTASVNSGAHVWINQGGAQSGTEGNFSASGSLLGSSGNRHVALSDVDGDGDLDLFIARNGPNTVWMNQDGVQGGTPGAFVDSGQTLGNVFSSAAALGDIDADNDPDALVANTNPSATEVWQNEGLSGLQVLYKMRDEVFAPTPQGQHYTNLYLTHNAELLSILLADPALFDQTYNGLTLWLPNFEALVMGNGDSVAITSQQTQAVDDFLNDVSAAASPTLQQVISDERAAVPPLANFVGKNMNEARVMVLGSYRVGLPIILRQADVGNVSANSSPNASAPTHASTVPRAPLGGQCVLYCLLTGDCD